MVRNTARKRFFWERDEEEDDVFFPSRPRFTASSVIHAEHRWKPREQKSEPWVIPGFVSIIRKPSQSLFDGVSAMAISWGVKTVTTGVLALAFGPAAAPIAGVVAGVTAVGIKTFFKQWNECNQAVKDGNMTRKEWRTQNSSKNKSEYVRAMSMAVVGGLVGAAPFLDDLFGDLFNGVSAPALPIEPVTDIPADVGMPAVEMPIAATPTPEAVPALSDPSAKPGVVLETPTIPQAPAFEIPESPQAQKDLAISLLYGPNADPERAVQLLNSAADAGNIQAKVDLEYLRFHELAGVEGTRAQAIEAMRALAQDDVRAADLLEQWAPEVVAPAIAVEDVSYASDNILETALPSVDTTIFELPEEFVVAEDLTGTPFSMSFSINAQTGVLEGTIYDAADKIPVKTVFETLVADFN